MSDKPTRLEDLEPLTEETWLRIATLIGGAREEQQRREEGTHEDKTA